MQTIIQVVCSKGSSLRDAIVNDAALADFGLTVTKKLKPGRQNGWAKIHSTTPGRWGALNVEWDSKANIMLCRVVNHRNGRPHMVLGDFVSYLLRRHRHRITVLSIVPPLD